MPETPSKALITSAINKIRDVVMSEKNQQDIDYFHYHEKRYFRMAELMLDRVAHGSDILDIGGHYLHPAMILTQLGYKVSVVDVSVFSNANFIQKRRSEFGINGIVEDNLESFESLTSVSESYDAVLFTEIFEHITFNPISFWKKVHTIIKDGGIIYLTTPNSMALPNVIRSLKNIFFLKGIGVSVNDILQHVTYGHHWKEYSRSEIKQYFKMLSDDFLVETSFFSYARTSGGEVGSRLWMALSKIGDWTRFLSSNIEAVIQVNKHNGFKLDSPDFY